MRSLIVFIYIMSPSLQRYCLDKTPTMQSSILGILLFREFERRQWPVSSERRAGSGEERERGGKETASPSCVLLLYHTIGT